MKAILRWIAGIFRSEQKDKGFRSAYDKTKYTPPLGLASIGGGPCTAHSWDCSFDGETERCVFCGAVNTLQSASQDALDNIKWRDERRNHPDGLLDKFDNITSAEEWRTALAKHEGT